MTYFKVINRQTRVSQILNSKEVATFFRNNNARDYAVSNALSPKDRALNNLLNSIVIASFGLAIVILATEIVRNIFTIL